MASEDVTMSNGGQEHPPNTTHQSKTNQYYFETKKIEDCTLEELYIHKDALDERLANVWSEAEKEADGSIRDEGVRRVWESLNYETTDIRKMIEKVKEGRKRKASTPVDEGAQKRLDRERSEDGSVSNRKEKKKIEEVREEEVEEEEEEEGEGEEEEDEYYRENLQFRPQEIAKIYIWLSPRGERKGGINALVSIMGENGINFIENASYKVKKDAPEHKGYVLQFHAADLPIVRTQLSRIGASYGYLMRLKDLQQINDGLFTVKIVKQLDASRIDTWELHQHVANVYKVNVTNVTHSRPNEVNLAYFFVHLASQADAVRLHNIRSAEVAPHIYSFFALTLDSFAGKGNFAIIAHGLDRDYPYNYVTNFFFRVAGPGFQWVYPKDHLGRTQMSKVWVSVRDRVSVEKITAKKWRMTNGYVRWEVATKM